MPEENEKIEDKEKLLLYDIKWRKLMKLSKYFSHFPFVEFVIVSGSMATGKVLKHSDFDLIISIKKGRIFTARYLLNLFFVLIGKRRMDDIKTSSPNKLCFNHFITEDAWLLKPVDEYGPKIYSNLVPLWGDEEKIKKFFKINSIYNKNLENHIYDLRFRKSEKSFFCKLFEKILGKKIGDYLEKFSSQIAQKRLSSYIKNKSGGRIIISDKELEFHFKHKN
jgi:predicted nucleotidyltransferase